MDHTVKAFSEELETLFSSVSRMGGLAEKALIDAIRSMVTRDNKLANHVIGNDFEIDNMQRDIEKRIMRLDLKRMCRPDWCDVCFSYVLDENSWYDFATP